MCHKNVGSGDLGTRGHSVRLSALLREGYLASSLSEMPGLITRLVRSISTDVPALDIISYEIGIQGKTRSSMIRHVCAEPDSNDASAEILEEQLYNEYLGFVENASGTRGHENLATTMLATDGAVK